jgi:hypothetical protein
MLPVIVTGNVIVPEIFVIPWDICPPDIVSQNKDDIRLLRCCTIYSLIKHVLVCMMKYAKEILQWHHKNNTSTLKEKEENFNK